MRINIPKSKRTQAIIAVAIAAVLVLSGAFAWSSFMQNRINTFDLSKHPGVNLHDDFNEGPDKDVYVENSGEVGVFVRIRLTEYLQTILQGSLIDGHDPYEGSEKHWHPHNGVGGANSCVIDTPYTHSANWPYENFHDYYTWTMGGQKYYKTAVAQLGKEGAFADNPEVCVDTEIYTELDEENGIHQTLFADVITMAEWLDGDREFGSFWIVDTDGWCYWASTLKPGEATGLLLDSVERTEKKFDSNATYMIDVWLQAVDEVDIQLFEEHENGGTTDGGRLLTQLLATSYLIIGEDGNYYRDMYNGTFIQTSDQNGKPTKDAKMFVPLVEASVNSPDRLYIDDTLTMTRLVWNGTDYVNFYEFDGNAPYYNLGNGGETVTITGVETGVVDDELYLKLSDGTYLASVTKNSPYKQSYPGAGPFAVIYADENGEIGTSNDMRYDVEAFEARYFYHIGNGIYVEVADENSTASYTDLTDFTGQPTTYYFSNTIHGELYEVNNLIGGSVDENVEVAFEEALRIGEQFGYYDAPNTGYSTLYKGDEMLAQQQLGNISRIFTMKPIYRHGEHLYIETTYIQHVDGEYMDYINFFIKGMGENGEFGVGFFGVMLQLVGDEMKIPEIQPPQGLGTVEWPFRIESRAQMDWVTTQVAGGNDFAGKHLLVVNDIDMSILLDSVGNQAFDTSFTPIGTETAQFKGTFDGDGKTIGNLKVTGNYDYRGLFGYIGEGGVVTDVTLVNTDIRGRTRVGGIAGYSAGTIEDCVVSGSVEASYRHAGGIVGYIQNQEYQGVTYSGIVTNCVNNASVICRSVETNTEPTAGGIVGHAQGGVIKDCTNNGTVYGESRSVGGIVGRFYIGGTIKNCHNTATVTGVTYVGGVAGYLNSNIEVSGCTNSNKVIGSGDTMGGIVGYNNGGIVTDCQNTGAVTATGTGGYIGGVVGLNGTSTTSAVKNCTNDAAVKAESTTTGYVGGIAGRNYGALTDCTNGTNGTVKSSYHYTGGIAGQNINNKITNCQNLGSVSSDYDYIGGIVGYASNSDSEILMCKNSGDVSGRSCVGGLVGRNYISGTIEQSFNTGAVNGSGSRVGGIVGENLAGCIIRNAYAWCNTTGSQQVGGVAGFNTGTVINTYHAKGIITSTYTDTGEARVAGLNGYNDGICTYNVALADKLVSITGSNFGKTIGSNQTSTPNNYAYDMPLTGGGAWVSGTGWQNGDGKLDTQTPSYFWWSQTFKGDSGDFNKQEIWTWDEANSLPVLKSLTQP